MKYSRVTRTLFAAALVMGFSTAAFAQATRTWVSGTGADANPCSRTAPCQTFSGALIKTATHGEISALDPGGFGTININKGITLNGTGTIASILAAGTTGIIVNAPTTDTVIIRDISINGASTGTNGVRYLAGKTLTLDHVWIHGFNNAATSRGVDMSLTNNGNLRIIDSRIQNINEDGIRVNTTVGIAEASIENTTVSDCGGDGIEILANARVNVSNTRIVHVINGVNATGANSATNLDDMYISNNTVGIRSAASSTRVSDSIIANNTTGLSIVAGTIDSFQGNSLIGNPTPGAFSTTTLKQ